jgi:hypothetical protein
MQSPKRRVFKKGRKADSVQNCDSYKLRADEPFVATNELYQL